jgi:hypothetical protein
VLGKLVVFEVSQKMGQEEATSSRKGISLTCDEYTMMKGNKQNESSSFSSEE